MHIRIHLVTLSRMDRLLLHRLDLQWLELLIEHLTQVHNNTFVNLLPQVSSEDLDQTDLQRRDLTVPVERVSSGICVQQRCSHEDTSQIQLHLETDVNVGAVDCGTPPERKPTVRNLVQTGTLGVRELLVAH